MKIRSQAVIAAAVVSLCSLAMPRETFAQSTVQATVNVFLGQKMLNKSDWEPTENQPQVGVESTVGIKTWPVHLAFDVVYSTASGKEGGVKYTSTVSEIDLGVRKIIALGNLKPYAGGGVVAYGSGERTASVGGASGKASDTGFGIWAGAGVFYAFGNLQAGIAARYSTFQLKDGQLEADGGGLQVGLIGGFNF